VKQEAQCQFHGGNGVGFGKLIFGNVTD